MKRKTKKLKSFTNEFKAFIKKGNVLDMAIGVIIGGAFGKIVASLVNDIIMPLVSFAVGGNSVVDWKWVIKPAIYNAEGVLVSAETAFLYGSFIQTVIDFLIIAFVVFIFMKTILAAKAVTEDVKNSLEHSIKSNDENISSSKVVIDESTVKIDNVKKSDDALKENEELGHCTKELLIEIRDLLKGKQAVD